MKRSNTIDLKSITFPNDSDLVEKVKMFQMPKKLELGNPIKV
jgi:hypothetical protein